MITVPLTRGELRLAEAQAQACALGGTSHIRGASDRAASLTEDQVIGQLGTIAMHKYWFGDLTRYLMGRYVQNQHKWDGDGGDDMLGGNLDVKTSLMRRSPDPLYYNLLVRPRERHDGWVYVLALVPVDYKDTLRVHLLGWLGDAELPTEPMADGPMAGAFKVPAVDLNALPPVRFNLLPDSLRQDSGVSRQG